MKRSQQEQRLIIARAEISGLNLSSSSQVAAVQALINRRRKPRCFRLLVQRTATEVAGPTRQRVSTSTFTNDRLS